MRAEDGAAQGAEVLVTGVRDGGLVWLSRLEPLRAVIGSDGTAVVDVTDLLATEEVASLDVRAMLNDYVPAAVQVTAEDICERAPSPTGAYPVELDLRRAATVVGTVLDDEGHALVGATAQVLSEDELREGQAWSPASGGITDGDGRFSLVVNATGPVHLAIAASGRPPVRHLAVLRRGATTDVGSVRLKRGAVLAGRLRGSLPFTEFSVVATWYGGRFERPRQAAAGVLWIDPEGVVRSRVEASVDREGSFRLEGLEPGPYRLRVLGMSWSADVHPDVDAECDRLVRAPDDRISVDVDRALLELEVSDGQRPVAGAQVTIEGRDRMEFVSGANGIVAVVVRAGARPRIEVGANGFEHRTILAPAVRSGFRQRERVVLAAGSAPSAAPPPPPSVRWLDFSVRGPDGMQVRVPFRLADASGDPVACTCYGLRAGLRNASSSHTPSMDNTMIATEHEGPFTLELGGEGFESKVIRLQHPTAGTPRDFGPVPVVLHAR